MTGMSTVLAEPPETSPVTRAFAAQARVAELMGIINAANAALVDVLAEVVGDDLWAGGGIRSPEHWVTWRCGLSAGHARALVATARRVNELPACAEAFRAGVLTEDQMAVIARHAPPERDTEVLGLARYAMVPQLQRALRTLPPPADPEPDTQERHRQVDFGTHEDGWWWCRMLLPPDEGAVVQKAFEVGRDAEFADRHPDGDPDGTFGRGDVGWSDGAMRAADAALAGFAAQRGSCPADRFQVLLHVNVDDPDRPAHLHLGPALPARLRRMLSCDASLRMIFEEAGVPVADSRLERTVPRRIRRLVENRDRGCRVHGCNQTRWLHVHHMVHWEDGGLTTLDNLVALCPFHHRRHHQGRLDIAGDPNDPVGLMFTDPQSGRRFGPASPRPPGDPPDVAAQRAGLPPPRWRGPSGERLDYWCISWN